MEKEIAVVDNEVQVVNLLDSNFSLSINYKFGLCDDMRYISDFITADDIESWNDNSLVWITSQTGSGKTYFIEKVLIKSLIDDNKNNRERPKIYLKYPDLGIVILVNRTALSRQVKKHIINFMIEHGCTSLANIRKDYTDTGLDTIKDIGFIHVYTYQELLSTNIDELHKRERIKYLIMDEAHFFTSDSMFNENTEKIYNKICKDFPLAIKIMMSATFETVFFPAMLEYREYKYTEAVANLDSLGDTNYYQDYIQTLPDELMRGCENGTYYPTRQDVCNYRNEYHDDVLKKEEEVKCSIYDLERDYGYIEKIYIFKSVQKKERYEELVSMIGSNKKEKWLIFIDNKKEGKSLRDRINKNKKETIAEYIETKEKEASFISSDNKNSDEYNDIVKQEKFKQRVLICTSVLDNGVNIKDKIDNVVIDSYDRTKFLQMLGRVRTYEKTTKIKLYVFERTVDDVEKELKQYQLKLVDRCDCMAGRVDKEREKNLIKEGGWYINNKGELYFSKMSLFFLVDSIANLRRVCRLVNNDNKYYPDHNSVNEGKIYSARENVEYSYIKNALETQKYHDESNNLHDMSDIPNMRRYIIEKRKEKLEKILSDNINQSNYDKVGILNEKLKVLKYLADLNNDTPSEEFMNNPPEVGFINAEYANWLEMKPDKMEYVSTNDLPSIQGEVPNEEYDNSSYKQNEHEDTNLLEKYAFRNGEIINQVLEKKKYNIADKDLICKKGIPSKLIDYILSDKVKDENITNLVSKLHNEDNHMYIDESKYKLCFYLLSQLKEEYGKIIKNKTDIKDDTLVCGDKYQLTKIKFSSKGDSNISPYQLVIIKKDD